MSSQVNKVFHAVFVINLKRSPDRLKEIDKQLKKLGINYDRVEAVDGAELTSEQVSALTTKNCKMFCTRSSIGCALSHMKAWRIIQRRGIKSAMILEDDAIFCQDFEKRFMKSWRQVPNDWSFVNIGCISGCGDRKNYSALDWGSTAITKISDWIYSVDRKGGTKISLDVAIPDGAAGCHCYAITNSGVSSLLKELEKVPYMGHIDILINSYGTNLKRYAFTDGSIVSQPLTTNASTIGGGGPPYTLNWLADKIVVNKRGVNLGWLMSETGIRLGPFEICAWDGLFLVIGVMLSLKRRPSLVALTSGLLLTDQFVFGKEKHLPKTVSYLIMLLLGYIVTKFLLR